MFLIVLNCSWFFLLHLANSIIFTLVQDDSICDEPCKGKKDCTGTCFGEKKEDECGVCGGDDSTCKGCRNRNACNYDKNAKVSDDATCSFAINGYDCTGTCQGKFDCAGECGGVSVPDDCGVCGGDSSACSGCTTDPKACNYVKDPFLEVKCTYPKTDEDGTPIEDCFGKCLIERDCLGVCGGTNVYDNCDPPICGGLDKSCDGKCDEEIDCKGICAGPTKIDPCGVCAGDSSTCAECKLERACNYLFSAPVANNKLCEFPKGCRDECISTGKCEAKDQACILECLKTRRCNFDCAGNCQVALDCDGECGGAKNEDDCGVCGGDNSSCSGCKDPMACNANMKAKLKDDDLCIYKEKNKDCFGKCEVKTDCLGVCGGLATTDDCASCKEKDRCGVCGGDGSTCGGCMDTSACNYNAQAKFDDESCFYFKISKDYDCFGNCKTDPDCTGKCGGYAKVDQCGVCQGDDSTCTGCIDEQACNYCHQCKVSAGASSCTFPTNPNLDCKGNCIVGKDCKDVCGGQARTDACGVCGGDGSSCGSGDCVSEKADCAGVCGGQNTVDECGVCMDPSSDQYSTSCRGCMESTACNFNVRATINDKDTCKYPEKHFSCDGVCLSGYDCNGVCGGPKTDCTGCVQDQCGVCKKPGRTEDETCTGCMNKDACNYDKNAKFQGLADDTCVFKKKSYNCAEVCIGKIDCAGQCDGGSKLDSCGVCGGDGTTCDGICDEIVDCENTCGGTKARDFCGVCGGTNSTCTGCSVQSACNYNQNAKLVDDKLCTFPPEYPNNVNDCFGNCAVNLDCKSVCGGKAKEDKCGVCEGNDSTCTGCIDPIACNYDPSAKFAKEGACTYASDRFPGANLDCSGRCVKDKDCEGTCGGKKSFDKCQVCGGPCLEGNEPDCSCLAQDCPGKLKPDCEGECGGVKKVDACGVCGGNGGTCTGCIDAEACNYCDSCLVNDQSSCQFATETKTCSGFCPFKLDCEGKCVQGKNAKKLDSCNICGGDGSLCGDDPPECEDDKVFDCSGECGGSKRLDKCGVCNGDSSTCTGCMNPKACNYNVHATLSSTCNMPQANKNCFGECTEKKDCRGVCAGTAKQDACGVCQGDGSTCDGKCDYPLDCNQKCGGVSKIDDCGICGGDGSSCVGCKISDACNYCKDCTVEDNTVCKYPESQLVSCNGDCKQQDCSGVCGGLARPDSCGVCSGSGKTCDGSEKCEKDGGFDCDGVCGGGKKYDRCGVCNGDGKSCVGCTDSNACNYNAAASVASNLICEQPKSGRDCHDNCIVAVDCEGKCGGTAKRDKCGVCEGKGDTCLGANCPTGQKKDCAGKCNGKSIVDVCGVCGGDESTCTGCLDKSACNYCATCKVKSSCKFPEENKDCFGNCKSDKLDCEKKCGGSAKTDSCGVCGGDGSSCPDGGKPCDEGQTRDCRKICGGKAIEDQCGVCGGDGRSCIGCTDSNACNFDKAATILDTFGPKKCVYRGPIILKRGIKPEDPKHVLQDCHGNCLPENTDCSGTCGGDKKLDWCDPPVCGGDGSSCNGFCISYDCAGVCEGPAKLDTCGVCEGKELSCTGCMDTKACNYCEDCKVPDDSQCKYPKDIFKDSEFDVDCAGNCLELDCNRKCGGDAKEDLCGVCEGGCLDVDENESECAVCSGCLDKGACNFDPRLKINVESACTFPENNLDCKGACVNVDCAGKRHNEKCHCTFCKEICPLTKSLHLNKFFIQVVYMRILDKYKLYLFTCR